MAFKAYLTGSSQYNTRPNDRVCLVDGGCVCCFETLSIFLSIFVKNLPVLPGVISLLFVTRSRMLARDLVSSMLSRPFILFFCFSSSNSTRRKPAQ